jgi:hypothetical protein
MLSPIPTLVAATLFRSGGTAASGIADRPPSPALAGRKPDAGESAADDDMIKKGLSRLWHDPRRRKTRTSA